MLVSGAILLYYAKRHPHPKFRPKIGELVLVGMIFFGISVTLTSMTAGLFEQENLDEGAKKTKNRSKEIRGGGGNSSDPGGSEGAGGENIFAEEKPPFVPEDE
jgi:hypothetical protein